MGFHSFFFLNIYEVFYYFFTSELFFYFALKIVQNVTHLIVEFELSMEPIIIFIGNKKKI